MPPGRPKSDTEAVNVRMDRAMLTALDAYIEKSEDVTKRPEAVREILAEFFQSKGLTALPEVCETSDKE